MPGQQLQQEPKPIEYTLSIFEAKAIQAAVLNISSISRTFKGESNTDVSPEKQPLLLSGVTLTRQVQENFYQGVKLLLSRIHSDLNDEQATAKLMIDLVNRLNHKLTNQRHGFFRSWDTPHPEHPDKTQTEASFYQFCKDLHDRRVMLTKDPVSFAAWSEHEFNISIHTLADGCGRTSKALGAGILIATGYRYPRFQSREEYFNLALQGKSMWINAYRQKVHAQQ